MGTPLKVLIVENSEDDAVLMMRYLRRNGYELDFKVVETAADFSAALLAEPWELILSDYMMPTFTGLDALRLCRRAGFHTPFILVSGSIGEERAVEALHAGANDYIMKDRIQRLAAAIERAIRETGIQRESLRAEAEILRLNAELRDKVELLSRSNAELDQFATIASHDLKEPLRTVTLYTELLLRKRTAAPTPDETRIWGYITSAVDRMRALIDGLLAYSKIAHEPRNPEAAADASIAVSNALISMRGPLAESGAIVTVDPLPIVVIESIPLTQVFQNLIANALKYRRPDELPRIHISGRIDHGTVRISVRDNGLGISQTHYERIFVLFRRLHGDDYPGIGLGLALCKRIVEQSGGEIWLESELGVGSTFHFTLPEQTKAAAATSP